MEQDLAAFVEAVGSVLSEIVKGNTHPKMEVVKEPWGMKAMAEESRPRERLHRLGAGALETAELLAILLCTGSSDISVLDLCNEDRKLLKLSAKKLCRFSGIGVAKSATLLAAFELGRRLYGAGSQVPLFQP